MMLSITHKKLQGSNPYCYTELIVNNRYFGEYWHDINNTLCFNRTSDLAIASLPMPPISFKNKDIMIRWILDNLDVTKIYDESDLIN